MEKSSNPEDGKTSGFSVWVKRMGIVGFMFFLLKGIGWLVLGSVVGKCALG
ncbi:MAG: hypothetical protein IPL49_09385 [Saprospirales bacterium]|nr:hypothetical protein [Saprospirales bacterium]MBK8491082.1 hypothetical protein [Saprospirales bacterium]